MNARHKKTGNIYRVVGMSLDTTSGREDQGAMVYTDELRLYHRDLAEFSEKFELVDGDEVESRLPCDVALPPGTIIRKGCTMSTLFRAMQRRKETGEGVSFSDRIGMDTQWPDAIEKTA